MPFITLLIAMCFSACEANVTTSQADDIERKEISHILETLCEAQVVLLGEGPTHGEGTTLDFKSDIAQALISDCNFELLLFEASFYEFLKLYELKNSASNINQDNIETALGFVYRDKIQLQSFINFINSEVNSNTLNLGGLDYQPGGRGQDYSNFKMLDDILYPKDSTINCKLALKQRIFYDYTKNGPYTLSQKNKLLNCLKQPISSPEKNKIRENLYHYIESDFLKNQDRSLNRSVFMYKNFKYWFELFKEPPKTIVWSSSAHANKSSNTYGGNLGSLVKQEFGASAYSLGFSALEGSVRNMQGEIENLPDAPKTSLEYGTFLNTEGDIVFLDTGDLSDLRVLPGAAIFNTYREQDWSTIFDGIVVFRHQKPALTR